ncbi:hypothetical protein KKF91_16475 [Myxococcota bacterium]|nr:hypothetical protein [Myxococcota bacterium]MBU1432132.1 hypothetical protein [Myxococcota bacterium]MBU1900082.1 hypothetical protein [Myxococcota bacterium]
MRRALLLALALLLAPLSRPARALSDEQRAQVELATWATLYGVGLGVWTSLELDLRPRPAAWVSLILGGGAFYGAWKAAEHAQFDQGEAHFIVSGSLWMAFNLGLLEAEYRLIDDGEALIWSLFGATALTAGGLSLISEEAALTPPQVMTINSAGLWGTVELLLFGATFHLGSGKHLPRDVFLLNTLSLIGGYALTRRYDPTEDQINYVNLGAFLGMATGALLGTMTAVVSDAWEPITGLMFVGAIIGVAMAVDAEGFDRVGEQTKTKNKPFEMVMPLWQGQF